MNDIIKGKIEEIKSILEDYPADASTHIMLSAMNEMLAPVHAKLMGENNSQSIMVGKQVKLITDVANAIIGLIDARPANMKG